MEQNTNAIVPKQGWSWGALVFNAGFLIGAKQYKTLWWYLLMFVPFVNFIFGIAFAIYLGMNGGKLAAEGKQFANQSEYDGYMKGMDHAGKIMFIAMIAVFAVVAAIFMIVGISFLAMMKSGVHAPFSTTP